MKRAVRARELEVDDIFELAGEHVRVMFVGVSEKATFVTVRSDGSDEHFDISLNIKNDQVMEITRS